MPVMRKFSIIAASIFTVAVIFSCSSDSSPDAGGKCSDTADCPDGYVCAMNIGSCVTPGDLEAAKIMGTPELSPIVLKKDETAVLRFESNRELLASPSVNISLSSKKKALTLDEINSSGRHYSFTYTADGSEPQALDCPITIVLTNKAGVKSPELGGGVLRFDFTSTP